MTFANVCLHSVNQDQIGSLPLQTARMAHGEDAFGPALAVLAACSKAAFAPKNREADHPFGVVVRGRDAFFLKKQPQMVHLATQAARELAGFVRSMLIRGQQANETRVKHAPFALRRRCFGHVAQPPQLFPSPESAARQPLVASFGKIFGLADKLSKARLPQSDPVAIYAVAVRYEKALPVLDQSPKCGSRASRMNHEQGDAGIGQDPQLSQFAATPPRSLVNVAHRGRVRGLIDGRVVRRDGHSQAGKNLLNPTLADRQPQYREQEILDGAATVSMNAAQFGDQGGQPRPKAGAAVGWNQRFAHLAAASAMAAVQDEMLDIEFQGGQLDELVDVVGFRLAQGLAAAHTKLRKQLSHLRKSQALLRAPLRFRADFFWPCRRSDVGLKGLPLDGGWLELDESRFNLDSNCSMRALSASISSVSCWK